MSASTLKVVVTGGAGQIGYSFLPLLCNGAVFGRQVRLDVRLLDIEPAVSALEGVKMELEDCAFTLLDKITPTTDLQTAFQDVDVAILIGGFPRKQGMLRKDLIGKNASIFSAQGQALEQYASRNVKVLVVANPANTNCLLAMKNAPSIPRENFSALTRLDHERMRSMIVSKLNAGASLLPRTAADIKQCMIWGNHSSTQFPDARLVKIRDPSTQEWQDLESVLPDTDWIRQDLIQSVQRRGAAVIQARKLSSAMSAARAIMAHMRDWCNGTEENDIISMAIYSTGAAYDIPQDLIFSFPVKCSGSWKREIVQGIPIDSKSQERIKTTIDELMQERTDAMDVLKSSNL